MSRSSSSGACREIASRRLEALVRELVDGGDEPDRRHRDTALREPEAVRLGVGQGPDRSDHPLVVGERLAHPHEDDVAQPRRTPGDLAVTQRPHTVDDLVHDLAGGQVPVEAGLSGGAERAVHPAARLRADAHGHPVRVAHQHGLDERAVEEPPQRLAGGVLVGRQVPHDRHQLGKQRFLELAARGGRDVRPLGGVVRVPGEVVLRELLGTKRLLTDRGNRLFALGGREIGKVPRRLLGSARRDKGEFSGLRHNPSSVADQYHRPRPQRGGGRHPRVPPVSFARPRPASHARGRPPTSHRPGASRRGTRPDPPGDVSAGAPLTCCDDPQVCVPVYASHLLRRCTDVPAGEQMDPHPGPVTDSVQPTSVRCKASRRGTPSRRAVIRLARTTDVTGGAVPQVSPSPAAPWLLGTAVMAPDCSDTSAGFSAGNPGRQICRTDPLEVTAKTSTASSWRPAPGIRR